MTSPRASSPQSDAQLATTVKQAIRKAVGPNVRNLEVTAGNKGSITISGICSTFYTKQLAQKAAMPLVEPPRELNVKIEVR